MTNEDLTNSNIEILVVEWLDSYGALSGWRSLEDYKPEALVCISTGIKVFEDETVIALAPNYANETDYTPLQGNGMMVIPKVSITKTSIFSLACSY